MDRISEMPVKQNTILSSTKRQMKQQPKSSPPGQEGFGGGCLHNIASAASRETLQGIKSQLRRRNDISFCVRGLLWLRPAR